MARAEFFNDIAVIFAALIDIFDQQLDRGAGCYALKHARQDLNCVSFFALCHVFARARFAHIEPVLQHLRGYRNTRRAPINRGPNRRSVAFAPSGDAEHVAEGVV